MKSNKPSDKTKSIKNIEASVRQRLFNKAKQANMPFQEILQYYAMERFLYRLSKTSYRNSFILKGALMFTVWDIPQRRTTLDIDFLARYENQISKIEKVIRDVCNAKTDPDGIVFDTHSVAGKRIKEDADYEGVRTKFNGFIARARIPMQVDVAFGDVVYPQPKTVKYPPILDFPAPRLKGYSHEAVIAEKFEAMVKLGLLNSRMKDFYDIWLMTRRFDFDGKVLIDSLRKTFQNRKTEIPVEPPLFAPEIYDENSDRQTIWKAFLGREQISNVPELLREAALSIEDFLAAPVRAISSKREFSNHWQAAGPWK